MVLNKIPEEKLFANHSKEVVSHWCKSLYYFHYMRARQGHNCEGDSFAAHFKYSDREDLFEKMALLEVELKPLDKDLIAFDPFGSYDIDDLDKIRYTIPGINDYEQPQEVLVLGKKVYIWIQAASFEISVSGTDTGNSYEVATADFEVCRLLENEFDRLAWNTIVDEEVTSHTHCISKARYPELY